MMMFGAPENTATPFIGAPLTMAENDGLPPSAMSSELAVSACTIFTSPAKALMSRSMPCFLKMPVSTPMSAGMKAN